MRKIPILTKNTEWVNSERTSAAAQYDEGIIS